MRAMMMIVIAAWMCVGTGCWAPRGVLMAVMISDKSLGVGGKNLDFDRLDPMVTTFGPAVTGHTVSPLSPAETLACYRAELMKHGWQLEQNRTFAAWGDSRDDWKQWGNDPNMHTCDAYLGVEWPMGDDYFRLVGMRLKLALEPQKKEGASGTDVYVEIDEDDAWVNVIGVWTHSEGGYHLILILPLIFVW